MQTCFVFHCFYFKVIKKQNKRKIIDIKKLSIKEIVYLLEQRSDNYQYYSDQVYKKFKEVIDFDEECNNIKLFIEKLL